MADLNTSGNIDPSGLQSEPHNATSSPQVDSDVKRNDGGADQIPTKKETRTNGSGSSGIKGWFKRHLGPGNGEEKARGRKLENDAGGMEGLKGAAGGIGVEDSTAGVVVGDPAPAGDILARDGGKGDGVIR